jgi:hypothetical protein
MPDRRSLDVAAAPMLSRPLVELSLDRLAEMATDPERLDAVRAEVYRRLETDQRKANFFTFRWLLPVRGDDDRDRMDSFEGLRAVCWTEVQFRHAQPHGDVSDPRDLAIEESIRNVLIDVLYELKDLPPPEIIRKALRFEFLTEKQVANAVRRQSRAERAVQVESLDCEQVDDAQTPLEVVEHNSQINPYNDAVDLLEARKSEIVGVLGEKQWEVLLQVVERIDRDDFPYERRESEAALTEIFAQLFDVQERQARTLKSRFKSAVSEELERGDTTLAQVAELLQARTRFADLCHCRETEQSGVDK